MAPKLTGAGIYCEKPTYNVSVSLEFYTNVFQTETYTKEICSRENIRRRYRGQKILILIDSQVAIKALMTYLSHSKLI